MENIIVYSIWHFSSSDTFCVFSVTDEEWKTRTKITDEEWKTRTKITDEEWKTRTKITDEDEMKDTYKSHDFKILLYMTLTI
jgi:hypothetical protein